MEKSTNVPALLALSLFINLCCHLPTAICAVRHDVVELGAKPDGKTESSKAFHRAWSAACASTSPAIIYIPPGKYFLRSAAFNGPCKNDAITFHIDGILVAPSSYRVNGNSLNWIMFRHVTGVSIHGGTLDGRGGTLWECKASGMSCHVGATSLEFSRSESIDVSGLTSLNSQFFHMVINDCRNVKIRGAKLFAAGNSPNTDGIHVGDSTGVTILDSRIATGDDCISVGPGSKNLWIKNIMCGPGHGISIGSLGKVAKEEGVENVTVSRVTFTGTQNGLRIKSWARPSTGSAKNVIFEHATMKNVVNPIIIDQHYCPHKKGCPQQFSGVKVSDVTYKDVHGTSATQVGVNLDCSSKQPCTRIKFQDVKLTYNHQIAQSSCRYAKGSISGSVQPSDCF